MGRPHRGHAHLARVVYSQHFDHNAIRRLQNLDKKAICQEFHKAMAFSNLRDNRSYARVLQSKPLAMPKDSLQCKKGDTHDRSYTRGMGLNPAVTPFVTDSCTSTKGRLPTGAKCKISPGNENSQIQGQHQAFEIPLNNRFQMLQDLLVDSDAPNTFHSESASTHTRASPTRERTRECNGERNGSTQTAMASTELSLPTCKEYWQCKEENGVDFGCVPLSPINLFTGDPTYWENIPDTITAHKLIRQSGIPNFLGLRIPVKTQLKIEVWRYHLTGYWDQQLIDLIQYGFPLDFDRSCTLGETIDNHASATAYASHVTKYIQDELQFGAMTGHFDEKPCALHISPFMTRDKAQSELRRTIIDLSWPKGQAVNDGVNKSIYFGSQFEMHYRTVNKIVKQLNAIGPVANIFKVDISRAFRHIRIDPGDIDLLGLQHQGKYFLDLSLPLGYKLGSFFFMKISDAVCYIMKNNGHNSLLNYIDDLIYTALPSTINNSYQFLLDLLQQLGLDISSKKLHPPSTQAVCLGILFDTVPRTVAIPPDKLQKIVLTCKKWEDKTTCTKNKLQSLLGSLLYVSKCVKGVLGVRAWSAHKGHTSSGDVDLTMCMEICTSLSFWGFHSC